MSRKSISVLAQTNTIRTRYEDAHELELKKLAIKREMEYVMAEYAKATGDYDYKKRKKKVGKAPNDYKKK